jgi:hypothetical protein
MFQVQAVPKIYESSSDLMSEDPSFSSLNYFRDDTDDQWNRTIDFTPSASIGNRLFCVWSCRNCAISQTLVSTFFTPKSTILTLSVRMGVHILVALALFQL